MGAKKSIAFYEHGSWYHRLKQLQNDGTTKYSKKGGFATAEEAERSYYACEEAYKKACRAYHASSSANFELADYMVFWLDEIYSVRVENASLMLASYVLYDLILPYVSGGVKLQYVSVEYLDALLKTVSKTSESAGNKSRELLNVAFKDAVAHGYISRNPVPDTKPYKRKKPTITVLNKEKMRLFLEKASKSNWYLEILLGLFVGLRKGEILGLKVSDFDMEHSTVSIKRQVTADPIVMKGQSAVSEYRVTEKEPKTQNSFRTLRVPEAVMEEVMKRKKLIDLRKATLGEEYHRSRLSVLQGKRPAAFTFIF